MNQGERKMLEYRVSKAEGWNKIQRGRSQVVVALKFRNLYKSFVSGT